MTKSEQLLSAFSEDYFFKELVFDDLCFTPVGGTKIELADLIINLGDIIIAIQLKERNAADQSFEESIENKWLQKKCKVAKGQVKESLQLISSGELPTFQNKRGQNISFSSNAEVIPLVVFENEYIDKYPHLLRKHSESGMNINCMSFDDYVEMCKTLVSPIEIASYLEYRKDLYEREGDIDIMIFDGVGDELIITKPTQRESLVMQFLAETYSFSEAENHLSTLQFFRNFLHQLPEHTVNSSKENSSYEILLFLAHMNRREISSFWDLLNLTKEENEKGKTGLLHSLRSGEDFVVLFVSGTIKPVDVFLPMIRRTADINRILEVAVYEISSDQFAIDFLYWESTKN